MGAACTAICPVRRARKTAAYDRRAPGGPGSRGRFAHSVNFEHISGEPVQLAFDAAFDSYILRAEPTSLGEFTIPVVTTEDLIEMKRRAAADACRRRSVTLHDQADIALLEGDIPSPHEGW